MNFEYKDDVNEKLFPLISVIIPVYKVEAYLQKCIQSVCDQTYKNLEIILVDDGSPDCCGNMCDEFAIKDNRIRVIHQENQGLSAARNAGLEIARGDLIGFVDSDDWIEPDMYEFLYDNLMKAEADMAVCGYYEHNKDHIGQNSNNKYVVTSTEETIRKVLLPGAGMVVWNKLFRRKLFSEIRFPEGKIYEDIFVMVKLAAMTLRTVWVLQAKYHYVRRSDSITMRPYKSDCADCVEAQLYNYEFVCNNYPKLEKEAAFRCIWAHFYVLDTMMCSNTCIEKKEKKKYIAYLKKNKKEIFSNPIVSKARKISLCALCVHEALYRLIVRLHKLQ